MEEKLKSLPLTILDILGILIPGLIWLVLLVTTFNIIPGSHANSGISPIDSLKTISSLFRDLNSPLLAFTIFIIISLIIGYTIRPIAMGMAEWFSLPFQKFHKSTRGFKLKELEFPFQDKTATWFWLVVSVITVNILSIGFCRLRYGEVANTYLNTLIAYKHFVRNKPNKNKK